MDLPKSIAIIGEGETEWFYFDSLRVACRYPFKIAPDMPQHSDILHMAKMAQQYIAREYDVVVCLVDMDRLIANKREMAVYRHLKETCSKNIMWIETNPCTEFWFLLHFMPELAVRHYKTYDEVLEELKKYMPGYEKTIRYFRRTKLFEFLRNNGDMAQAMKYSEQLVMLRQKASEDIFAYSEIHRVLDMLHQWANLKLDDKELKNDFPERIGKIEEIIIDFLTHSPDSDLKTISKAVGLRQSRTSDYLKRLIENCQIECSDGWRKTYRLLRSKEM